MSSVKLFSHKSEQIYLKMLDFITVIHNFAYQWIS